MEGSSGSPTWRTRELVEDETALALERLVITSVTTAGFHPAALPVRPAAGSPMEPVAVDCLCPWRIDAGLVQILGNASEGVGSGDAPLDHGLGFGVTLGLTLSRDLVALARRCFSLQTIIDPLYRYLAISM